MEARILFVDNDTELTALMAEFFAEQGFALGAAHTGPDGYREAVTGAYDLVLRRG